MRLPAEARQVQGRAPAAGEIVRADRAIGLVGQLGAPDGEARRRSRASRLSAWCSELWPRKMTPSARLVVIAAERSSKLVGAKWLTMQVAAARRAPRR